MNDIGCPLCVNDRTIELQEHILEKGRLEEIPIWFPGARLNYAENLLHRRDDGVALTEADESGVVIHITFRELYQHVRVMAAALRVNGLKIGDRVAGKNPVLLKSS
jgi:acetoacetyl-CoA synthetase